MNEQLRSQISAFLDDELPPGESELLVRRLGRDMEMHATATRYLLIGQVLRGEVPGGYPLAFSERIRRGIDSAADDGPLPGADLPPASARGVLQRWRRAVGGAAAVAGVALVAVAGLQVVSQREAAQEAALAVVSAEPEAYTVTRQAADAMDRMPVTQPPIRLTNYLMSHGEYAGSLGRKTIHSGIVGTSAAQVMGGYLEINAPAVDDTARDPYR